MAPNALLVGLDAGDAVHLVIGTNPLAAARCSASLASGAHPIVVAPDSADLHYGLQGKIDDGSVKWEKKVFEDSDLLRLGRAEVDHVVDAVFVTSGDRDLQSESMYCLRLSATLANKLAKTASRPSANATASPSMSSTHLHSAHSRCFRRTPTAPYK